MPRVRDARAYETLRARVGRAQHGELLHAGLELLDELVLAIACHVELSLDT